MDTNAEQFSRQGNPWDGEPVLRGQARKARRKAGVRPCRAGTPRRLPRESREESESFADLQARDRIFALVKAARGASRTVVPSAFPETVQPLTREYCAPRAVELTGWEKLERQVRRIRQRAEFAAKADAAAMAWQASEACRLAERRRLEAMRDAIEARLLTV